MGHKFDLGFIEVINKHQEQTENWLDAEKVVIITEDVLKITTCRLSNLSDWEAEDTSSTIIVTQKEYDKLIKIEAGGDFELSEVYSTTSYQEAKDYIFIRCFSNL